MTGQGALGCRWKKFGGMDGISFTSEPTARFRVHPGQPPILVAKPCQWLISNTLLGWAARRGTSPLELNRHLGALTLPGCQRPSPGAVHTLLPLPPSSLPVLLQPLTHLLSGSPACLLTGLQPSVHTGWASSFCSSPSQGPGPSLWPQLPEPKFCPCLVTHQAASGCPVTQSRPGLPFSLSLTTQRKDASMMVLYPCASIGGLVSSCSD